MRQGGAITTAIHLVPKMPYFVFIVDGYFVRLDRSGGGSFVRSRIFMRGVVLALALRSDLNVKVLI